MTTRLLLCAAFEPEIAQLRALALPHTHIATLGIGLVAAAARLGQLLSEHRPQHVIFTGTAGSSDLTVAAMGSVVRASHVHLLDSATLQGQSFFPPLMTTTIESATTTLFATLPTLPLLSPLAISATASHVAQLQTQWGSYLENLEGFAVATACLAAQIPYDIIVGISNAIGPDGHQQWQAQHEEVSCTTQTEIMQHLKC